MTTPTPIVYYWVLTTGPASAPKPLHKELAITYPDQSTGLGKMIDWMDAHKDIIRSAKSVDLAHVTK